MNTLQRCKPLLGTYVDISLSGDVSDEKLIEASNQAFAQVERIQQLMSFHNKESELSQVNLHLLQHPNQPFKVSAEMNEVLNLSLHLYKNSSHYFDISIAPQLIHHDLLPKHFAITGAQWGNSSDLCLHDNLLWATKPLCIDLGGIAKGYAVDCAIKALPSGLSYSLNAGGDLYESEWQNKAITIKYGQHNNALKNLTMKNHALATSGNYYLDNQSDIINPQNKLPHHFKGSVSVFADNVMLADALTKVVMLAPRKTAKMLLNTFNAQAVLINRWGFKRQLS